jgi:hypothetical protein
MLNWWLTTLSLVGFLVILIGLVLFALKRAVNTEDPHRIDPIPIENDDTEKKNE